MKMVRHWYQSVRAYVRLRTIAFVLIAGVLAAVAAPPAWWAGRLATNTKAQDDYAPLNQGQLKNLVRAAADELGDKLPGGSGGTLAAMVASWTPPTAQTDDYAGVNLGQLKAAAALVYDRCMEAGYVTQTQYPWDNSAFPPDDYALANIGQAKNLFAFDLGTRTFSAYRSPGGDGIAYQWKLQYGLDPNNPNLASEIAPGGITYLQKYELGLDPTKADSDGDGDSDGDEIAGGTNPKDPASRLAHAAVEVAIHSSVTQATSTFGGGPLGTFHEVLPPTPFGGSGSAVFSVDDPMNPGETITIMDGLDMGQMGEYDWGVALATSRPEVDYEHAEWKTDWQDSTEVLVDVNGNPFRRGSWSGTYHYLTEDIDPGMTVQTGVWVRNDRIASVPSPQPDDAYEHAGAWMAWGEYKFTDLPYGDIGIGVETTSTAFNLVRGAWFTMKIDASLDEATRKLYPPTTGPYVASTSADGKYGNRIAFWIKTDNGKPAGADITRSYVKVTTSAPSPGGSTPDPVVESVQLTIPKTKTTSSTVISLAADPGKTVSLLPVEIASANDPAKPTEVPLNTANSKQTSQDKPFVWWMNDDDDGSGQGDEQMPPGHKDFSTHKINSSRDLEDFTPLGIYIGGLQDAIAAGTFQIGLKWKNTTGNPSIAIFKAYEQTGSFTYVKQGQDAVADAQRGGEFGQALIDKNNKNVVDGGGFVLKPAFWSGFSASNPKKYLLFEGVTEGKGELTLVFYDQSGTQIGEGGSMWIDIKNVKKLYDRARTTPDDLPTPYSQQTYQLPSVGTDRNFSNEAGLSAEDKTALAGAYEKPWWESKECIVFVHGWNMSGPDFVGYAETKFKRLRWQGYTGRFAAFRWDTRRQDTTLDTGEYNRSEHRAFVYGGALKGWVAGFTGYTVSVVGHSMGNVVCGEALREGMQVKNYLLMEAAIPASCYDPNVANEGRLAQKDAQVPTPDWHLDANTNQQTLGYRGYLENVSGNIVNFYNEVDFALQTGITTIGSSTWPRINANWVQNQLDYKPDGNAFWRGWGYFYFPIYRLEFRAELDGWPGIRKRYVDDSWEMKAFVARSRTRAVGAQAGLGGPILENIDLQRVPHSFGSDRSDHSGQYTRRIQQVFDLYTIILNKAK